MAVRQYIGARYVPKFYENSDNTSEWRAGVIYEPLTIVTYNNNTYTSKRSVPANIGNPSDNAYYWVATGNFNQQIQELTEIVNEMEDDIQFTNDSIALIHSDIITVKDFDDTIDGFPYAGFCGGCNFAGMELYAFRVAPEHVTHVGSYGKLVFYQRKNGNVFERVNIEPNYNSAVYGELRDPNLSVSRDGQRLYVSCFTTIDESSETHYSIVFCFDTTLTQIGVNIIPNSVFWGNTLETPSGFLIHCDYADSAISLYRTTQAITSANFASASWVKYQPFSLINGHHYAEGNIGYFNNRLVMITRVGGTYSSEIAWTSNLEGITHWTPNAACGKRIHAPALLPYYKGEYLPVTGSILDANLIGDATKRLPYFSLFSFNDRTISSASFINQIAGGLIVGVNDFAKYGGYTTIVKISDTTFGVMYYEDGTDENAVRFVIVNLNSGKVNYNYISEEVGVPDVMFTSNVITAFSGSLKAWCVEMLHNTHDSFTFTSAASASAVTDKPTGLQSNFYGMAKRVSTQYYIEVNYFNGTTPKKAAVTGTAETIIEAEWTILY